MPCLTFFLATKVEVEFEEDRRALPKGALYIEEPSRAAGTRLGPLERKNNEKKS